MGWKRCNCVTALDHLLWYLSLPFPLACGSKPICGKERTLKEPFFSRRSSFTHTPLLILSVAQFLSLSLAFRLSLWCPWRSFFFFQGGGVAGAILAASLSSGKRAGFSDINGLVGGMAGGVWGRKRQRPQTSPLNGYVLFYTAAVSCPTADVHLQRQQA